MASYNEGKKEVVIWICDHVPEGGTILDVGACDGRWADFIHLIDQDLAVDGVEIFAPNVWAWRLWERYRSITIGDIEDLHYEHYDMVIFGDVLEHMSVEKAQRVLAYAAEHATDYVIGIPFEYPQEAIYGNQYEAHIQDDLTPEIFDERYPGHELLVRAREDYAYYHRRKE